MERSDFFPMYLFAAVLIAAPATAESIGDFAPMEVGTVWEYTCSFNTTGLSYISGSISVKIDLLSKEIAGADSLIILRIQENGSSSQSDITTLKDTTIVISREFMDTAIVRGDSVFMATGNSGMIFPFWKKHEISPDTLDRILYGNDSLYSYHTYDDPFTQEYSPNVIFSTFTYLQDVGLRYAKYRVGYTRGRRDVTISLVSYNNRPAPVAIKTARAGCSPRQYTTSSCHAKRVFLSPSAASGIELYSLSGKKIGQADQTAAGIGIGREKMPVGQQVR